MNNNFEMKKRIVEAGGSRIFEDWSNRAGISREDFVEGLKWVCNDPCDGGWSGKRLTRELGCVAAYDSGYGDPSDPFHIPPVKTNPDIVGLHKLNRVYGDDEICTIYDAETGEIWMHSPIRASISARDRI